MEKVIMISLSIIKRKVKTLLLLERQDKLLIIEAFLLTGIFRIVVLIIPFKKYKKYIGIYNEETPLEINKKEYRIIKRIAWAVNSVSKITPWESKCLVQALTAQRMLKRRKVISTIYFGLNKGTENNMQAHAWLRCGQIYVTGGHNKNGFKEVARFAIRKTD